MKSRWKRQSTQQDNATHREILEDAAQLGRLALEVDALLAKRLDRGLHLDDALEQLAIALALRVARLGSLGGVQGELEHLFALLESLDLARNLLKLRLHLVALLATKRDVLLADRTTDATLAASLLVRLLVLDANGSAAVGTVGLAVRLVGPVAALLVADTVVHARA